MNSFGEGPDEGKGEGFTKKVITDAQTRVSNGI